MNAGERPDFRGRCEERLEEIVRDAAGEPPLFRPLDLTRAGHNAEARLVVKLRAHPKLPDPDECELAILELLYLRGRTREGRIVELLSERFSESTVYRRLRRMRRLGVVTASRKTPRGYDLDRWLRSQADGIPA